MEMLAGTDRVATQEQRVIDAALRCIARWGIAKTTLDDIAREASCSRATIYRLFPGGKDALLEATAALELHRFFTALGRRLDDADGLEDMLVAGIVFAARSLAEHEALQFVLAYEPEVILPRVAFRHADRVLSVVTELTAPYLARHVVAEEAPRAAEWVARIVLAYTLSPPAGAGSPTDAVSQRLCSALFIPGFSAAVPGNCAP